MHGGYLKLIKPYQSKGTPLGKQTERGSFQPLVFGTHLGTQRTARTY